jgi:succinate-semialdehyde dehydrogenase / glutarate-semialdehyde dehydrogenase
MVVQSWRTAQLQSQAHLQVYNPANGQSLGVVDVSTSQETGEAIEAASEAWETWKNTTAVYRASLLHEWRELMVSNISDIQRMMTIESGKPLKEAAGEIQAGLASLDWFAGEAIRCSTPSPVCTAVLAW